MHQLFEVGASDSCPEAKINTWGFLTYCTTIKHFKSTWSAIWLESEFRGGHNGSFCLKQLVRVQQLSPFKACHIQAPKKFKGTAIITNAFTSSLTVCMHCFCWPSLRQGLPAEDTHSFPVHTIRHVCVSCVSRLWVVFDLWVLKAIMIPGKIVLLEFSLQFPFMTLCYYLAIVWHLQIAHTWEQKRPKYHPDITAVSLIQCSLLSSVLLYLTDLHYKSTSLVHIQDSVLPTEF